ncbi:MAG: hypothetical protein Q7T20_19600 [Saprospiraceae bacterium]|nr:hypothetical protein [Saprospiraceae bacterium]
MKKLLTIFAVMSLLAAYPAIGQTQLLTASTQIALNFGTGLPSNGGYAPAWSCGSLAKTTRPRPGNASFGQFAYGELLPSSHRQRWKNGD